MSIESKLHLVPVLKSAVDPRAGIILRTYYIRPEKLRKQIEQARQVPAKPYIVKIPFYNELQTAISTDNILPLYKLFAQQKNEKVWQNVVTRNEMADTILTNKHYKQLLGQNVYAFLLTFDKLQLKTIPQLASKSSIKKKLVVTSTEKPVKPKLKRSKRAKIKEQFELKTTENPFELNESLQNPDYGIQVKYKEKLYTINDGKSTATYLSNLINFLNMNPAKVKALVAKLISTGTLNDKYDIVKHLKLKPTIYEKEAPFWIPLLEKLIPETEDMDSLIFQSLILWKLDKKSANIMMKSGLFPDAALNIIKQPIQESINNPKYGKFALRTLLPQEAESLIPYATKDNVIELAENLDRDKAYALIKNILKPSAEQFIQNALNENINSLGYYIMQIAASQPFKLEYIPYSEFIDLNQITYIPSVASKIYPLLMQDMKQPLLDYIAKNNEQVGDELKVGLKTPNITTNDLTFFIRMKPLHLFEAYDKGKHNVMLELKKDGVFFKRGNKILVASPINFLKGVFKN